MCEISSNCQFIRCKDTYMLWILFLIAFVNKSPSFIIPVHWNECQEDKLLFIYHTEKPQFPHETSQISTHKASINSSSIFVFADKGKKHNFYVCKQRVHAAFKKLFAHLLIWRGENSRWVMHNKTGRNSNKTSPQNSKTNPSVILVVSFLSIIIYP